MIKFSNVSYGFPQKDLYNEICFEIENGEHAVLIGSNGTGKSTLVDMIIRTEDYLYDGKIEKEDNIRIGYVSQFVKHETNDVTAYDYLAEPFVNMLAKSDEICAKMETAENMEEIYEQYQVSLDEIDAVDGYNYDTNIKKQLAVAGIKDIVDLSINKISGGEFKLLSIIRNMLLKPQLLIMDEPDVFLDFENIVGLSKLINNYGGTVLTITHSRLLLSQCFNKILHLENQELQEFPGKFSEYTKAMLDTKIGMREQATKDEEVIEAQKKIVEKLRASATYIDNPAKGRQLKARVTYLERLEKRKVENPFIEEHNYNFKFAENSEKDVNNENINSIENTVDNESINSIENTVDNQVSSEETCEEEKVIAYRELLTAVENYSLTFDKVILSNVSFEIYKGDKIAIVGANGTGKSSLLKDLYERIQCEKPEIGIGYFAQIYDSKDESKKLSGGEKNIKQLKDIAENKTDVLFLDEPTSHLDTYAQMALEQAVLEYKGTVILVSHDFYTIANCADRILLLENGTLRQITARNYRKSIYKKYFDSDIFEQERMRKEYEIKINTLLKEGKAKEAKEVFEKLDNM
ncbi:MAG: ATP-binding cassette domain-containing protein [Lachnospiraceae bacterium]|nr:ATP-binding cassette domain-containing protein [Lachnospiraceae bacterium]